MNFRLIIIFISICFHSLYSQESNYTDFYIFNKDTIFIQEIEEVNILGFKEDIEKKRYYILKRKVLKVYPYSIIAKEYLIEMQQSLDSIYRKRHKKRYIKQKVSEIKEKYSEQLKELTMSEGKILVKLIYRQTKTSSYEIIKSYRGRFNAFFWQALARLWSNNLKIMYDPVNVKEDMLIEHIILQDKLEEKPY